MGATELEPLQEARRVLAAHRPTEEGICGRCAELWGRLVWYPCTTASWAAAVDRCSPTPETCAVLGLPANPASPDQVPPHRQAS